MQKNKIKIYISGQISGLPIEQAQKNFKDAELMLISKGFEVINPFELPEHAAILKNGESHNEQWIEHMKVDIKALMDCDSIYMLRYWGRSKGANIELNLAIELNYDIIYE